MLNFYFWQNKRKSRFLLLKKKSWSWFHISLTHVSKRILRNCFLKESCMALCLIGSTRMSVGLSIKWSVNRSWKENRMPCCIWKFGFKWFISVTIMWLWIYCKNKTKKRLKAWFWWQHVCIHMFVNFSDYFWSAVQRKHLGQWVTDLFLLLLEKDNVTAFPCTASRSAALNAWNRLPLLTLTLRFYLWVIPAKR